jgi:hypothetical protein
MDDRFSERLGLGVPHGWWASASLLKSFEAAGFAWVQVHAPPSSVLAEPRQCVAYAAALRASLATTRLRPVVHAPDGLRAGSSLADAALEGLLSYAVAITASQGRLHIIAERRKTSRATLVEPVLDLVTLFHLHDNLGARWAGARSDPALDPLRLDLHLPPGAGTLPWPSVAPTLRHHRAALICEVHPPHLGKRAGLFASAARLIDAIAPAVPGPATASG